jgi:hypothetical protein
MPKRRTICEPVWMPTMSSVWTAGMLRDLASAVFIGTSPLPVEPS